MSSFDVKTEGKGIWFVIHTLALNATTDIQKESFILTMNVLCDNFGCDTCKSHFRKFIDNYPLKSYWDITYKAEDIGFFKWSWELHNIVNKALKKHQISFDEALFKYKNYVCKNCDKSGPILVEVKNNNANNTHYNNTIIAETFNLVSHY
jgi:hypothetical protein